MEHLQKYLDQRKAENAHRQLNKGEGLIDFCSNDYLGFARSEGLAEAIEQARRDYRGPLLGSTGSRLISGHSALSESVEEFLTDFYNAESALVFNSGYDANIGFWSSVPKKGDTVIYDEYIHASIRDGLRMSPARSWSFRHLDNDDLREKIDRAEGRVYVAIESVYSMDGDQPNLSEVVEICSSDLVNLVVDEAHAVGVFGNGKGRVFEEGLSSKVDARIVTFGKAFGVHGAAVLGNSILKDFLINFARSLIYTTSMPPEALIAISTAHKYFIDTYKNNSKPDSNIDLFKELIEDIKGLRLNSSNSPIQCLLIPGNDQVKTIAEHVRKCGFDVRPILHPTVPKGKERLRIVIHTFNSSEEIRNLCSAIREGI